MIPRCVMIFLTPPPPLPAAISLNEPPAHRRAICDQFGVLLPCPRVPWWYCEGNLAPPMLPEHLPSFVHTGLEPRTLHFSAQSLTERAPTRCLVLYFYMNPKDAT